MNDINKNKADKLLEALSDTDDDMILAADPARRVKRRLPLWVKIGSAAAAVLVVGGVTAGVMMNRPADGLVQPGQPTSSEAEATSDSSVPEQNITAEVSQPESNSPVNTSVPDDNTSQPEQGTLTADEDLPKITAKVEFGAMGFEGYLLNEMSDLTSGNPWSEAQNITVMPVYKNRVQKDGAGGTIVTGLTYYDIQDELKTLLKDTAARMGVTFTDEELTDNAYSAEVQQEITEKLDGDVPEHYFDPTAMKVVTSEFTIETDANYVTDIEFTEPIKLPFSLQITDYDKAIEAAEYLMQEYSDLLDMEAPAISIDGGDYNYYGERSPFEISFYESAGTPEQDIENYFMNNVRFIGNEYGDLWIIRIVRYDLAAELVGNYPLITTDEATEKLKNGEFATSVPVSEGYKPESYDRVELVYRTRISDENFIPYYKFWIDVTEEIAAQGWGYDEPQKTYGAFYIPAVRPEYLEDTPTYDGSFN